MTAEYQAKVQRYFALQVEMQSLTLELAGISPPAVIAAEDLDKRGYSLKEACEYVGLPKTTFRSRVIAGLIKEPRKVGAKTTYLREDLDAYLDGMEGGSN